MLRLISFFMTLLLGIIIAPVVYKAIREHQETHGQRIVSDLQDAAHQAAAALQPKPDQQQRIAANLQNAAHQIVGALQSKFAQNAPRPNYSGNFNVQDGAQPTPNYSAPTDSAGSFSVQDAGQPHDDPALDVPGEKWQVVSSRQAVSGSFTVPRWRAWQFHVNSASIGKRTWVLGAFETNKPVMFAIVTTDNFTRLRQGYPFYTVYRAGPGARFSSMLSPGDYALVFYQVRGPSPEMQIPSSAAGLVAMAVRGIMNSQPAHVMGGITVEDDFYTTDAQAESMREQIQQQTTYAQ